MSISLQRLAVWIQQSGPELLYALARSFFFAVCFAFRAVCDTLSSARRLSVNQYVAARSAEA